MSEPTEIAAGGQVVIDYTKLDESNLLRALSDDASVWTKAFVQHAKKVEARGEDPLDEGWLITWFANAIEHSSDVRRWRSEPQTRPVLSHTLSKGEHQMNEKRIREIFAEKLRYHGAPILAAAIENATDNSNGGRATMDTIHQVIVEQREKHAVIAETILDDPFYHFLDDEATHKAGQAIAARIRAGG